MKRAFALLAVLMFGCHLRAAWSPTTGTPDPVSRLREHYLTQVPSELGAPNVVTGILITFRGFDTLGEVAVLFMVAASVGLLLARKPEAKPRTGRRDEAASEIVQNGAEVCLPLIFLFGVYVIMNGHLSAGGGFQGGAVVASGVMLLVLALPRLPAASGFPQRHGIAGRCPLRFDRHPRAGLRRRIPRQPLPAPWRIRHVI